MVDLDTQGIAQNHRPHRHKHTHTHKLTLTNTAASPLMSTWNTCRVEQQKSRISQPGKWRQLYSSGVQSIVPQEFSTINISAIDVSHVPTQNLHSGKQSNKTISKNNITWLESHTTHHVHFAFFIFCIHVQPPLFWSKQQISNYLCDAPGDIKECPYYRSARIKGSRACDCDKGLVEAHFWNSLRVAKHYVSTTGVPVHHLSVIFAVWQGGTRIPRILLPKIIQRVGITGWNRSAPQIKTQQKTPAKSRLVDPNL